MILTGCKMLRLCNVPGGCTPGVANKEENYTNKEQRIKDVVTYKLNMASEIRHILA